ncbi:uncharacterized protein LOC144648312 [Oculina patagonica]
MSNLLDDQNNPSTRKATKGSHTILKEYLQEKKITDPVTAEELAWVLPKFYAEVRKKGGNPYSKTSLCAIRFGLSRHFKQALNVDIVKDKEFIEANRVYEAQCKELKKQGLATTEHKPPIADEDIKKLYESDVFNTENPTTLQNKVFFEILLFFRRFGRHNLRLLKKKDFEIKVNSQGKRSVTVVKSTNELAKNPRVHELQSDEGEMMIANDGPFCPVFSFVKYLTHLNPYNKFFFQRPKSSSDGQVWYDNLALGEHALGKRMKVISQQAELSTEYTNFSIRAMSIETLDRCGFGACYVSESSSQSDSSIESYSKAILNTKTNMTERLMPVNKNLIQKAVSNADADTGVEPETLLTSSKEDAVYQVYKAQCEELEEQGLATTEDKPLIADKDIKKLYECGVFNTENPTTLQNKVFFEIMLFFGRPSKKSLRQLKKNDFEIKVNSQGKRCVVKSTDELAKNTQVHELQSKEGEMMIANDGPFCPVFSFEKYRMHLNPCNEFFFQRPQSSSDGLVWYDNMVVGENALGKKMKILSQQAELSTEYTNQAIRATTLAILDRCGFEAGSMHMGSSRSEGRAQSYNKTNLNTKTNMAGRLMAVVEKLIQKAYSKADAKT